MYNNNKYLQGFGTIKKYGNKYKVTVFKSLLQSGFECDFEFRPPKGTVNDEKLEVNISRARSLIFELALCNPWKYFCTLTIDGIKCDRFDLDNYRNLLARFFRKYREKVGCNIQYLLIPEQHKNGAWHMHGFLMNVPPVELKTNSHGYLDWPAYSKRFGYISLSEIKNSEACSKYITKYISKDMASNNLRLGAHLYYHSRGLLRAEVIKKDLIASPIRPDYENEYVKVQWFNGLDDALSLFVG